MAQRSKRHEPATVSEKAPAFERRTINLTSDLLGKVDTALFQLKRSGLRVSFSGFVEIAVRELLARGPKLKDVLGEHEATPRRKG